MQRFRLHSRTSGGQSLEWVVVTRSSEDWWDVLLPMAIDTTYKGPMDLMSPPKYTGKAG